MVEQAKPSLLDFTVSAVKIVVFLAMLSLTVVAVDHFVEEPGVGAAEDLKERAMVKKDYLDLVKSLSIKRGNNSAIHPDEWNVAITSAKKAINNNTDYDDAIKKFSKIKYSGEDSKYKKMAEYEISRLESAKKNRDKIDSVISKLKVTADPLIKNKEYIKVASLFNDYDGPFKEESSVIREAFAKQYQDEAKKYQATKKNALARAEQERDTLLAVTVPLILKGDYSDAKKAFLKKEPTNNVADMKKTLTDLADVKSFLVDSFTRDIGKTVKISTDKKEYNVVVKGVKDGRIYAQDSMGKIKVGIRIKLTDLTVDELAKRLNLMDETARNIFVAMQYLDQDEPADARIYLSKTGYFQKPMEDQLSSLVEKNKVELAKNQYERLLKRAGIRGDFNNDQMVVAQLGRKKVTGKHRAYIQKMSSHFKERHNEYASQHNDVLQAIESMIERSRQSAAPKADAKVDKPKDVAAKPVKIKPELFRIKTREDLFRSLKMTNPSYDLTGDFGTDSKDRFNHVDLTDAKIDSVAVLKNLDLEYLNISGTSVKDIAAVKKMPLKVLVLDNSKVTDLMPIRHMRTLRELYMTGIPVDSLKELNILKLEKLGFDPSKIKDPNDFKILRKMKSLETVFTPHGDFDMARFWVKLEAGDFKKPPPENSESGPLKYAEKEKKRKFRRNND